MHSLYQFSYAILYMYTKIESIGKMQPYKMCFRYLSYIFVTLSNPLFQLVTRTTNYKLGNITELPSNVGRWLSDIISSGKFVVCNEENITMTQYQCGKVLKVSASRYQVVYRPPPFQNRPANFSLVSAGPKFSPKTQFGVKGTYRKLPTSSSNL